MQLTFIHHRGKITALSRHMSSSIKKKSWGAMLALAIGALGVVYGDIGTSPLYAMREVFYNHHFHIEHSYDNVLGAVSLIIWALTIIVSFKYVVLVLRADNEGEGGVFALYDLIRKYKTRLSVFATMLLVFAAGLLFGDGVITPAISVLSSIEGLTVLTPFFNPYVVPITVIILTGLFAIQSKGTAKIGAIFGPIVGLWFFSLIYLGLRQIINFTPILFAFNPIYAFNFLLKTPFEITLLVLGSVMLVVTGGEAMYADMGHFGRLPIRLSWFSIVYPALIINYLGQGAFILGGGEVIEENLFFSMVPKSLLLPMVVLATMATIIASQALITGAFSLATQAVNLKLFPFLKIDHTHEEHEGQIYVPFVNWLLYVGCVILVIVFGSSSNLASAYGLAVSGVMLITTISMIAVSTKLWGWKPWFAYTFFGLLAVIDSVFLFANSLKFLAGGYVPVGVAVVFYILMQTWKWGSDKVSDAYSKIDKMTVKELINIKVENKYSIPSTMVFLTKNSLTRVSDTVPLVEQIVWQRYKALPKNLLFLTVIAKKTPHIKDSDRYSIKKFYEDTARGSIYSVILRHGFMEEIDLEMELVKIAELEKIAVEHEPEAWIISMAQERISFTRSLRNVVSSLRAGLFVLLSRNSATLDEYWGLGKNSLLSIEVVPVKLNDI